MSITLEQLQSRSEARNVAQWDWRVLDPECHMAGNSPILNLRFERSVKPARSHRGVRRMLTIAKIRRMRAGQARKGIPARTQYSSFRGL